MTLTRLASLLVLTISVAMNVALALRARGSDLPRRGAWDGEDGNGADVASEVAAKRATLATCTTEVARLNFETLRMLATLRTRTSTPALFGLRPRDEEMGARMQALVDERLKSAAFPTRQHHVECRDVVCKLTVTEPETAETHEWRRPLIYDTALRQHVSHVEIGAPTPGHDPRTKEGITTWVAYLTLTDSPPQQEADDAVPSSEGSP